MDEELYCDPSRQVDYLMQHRYDPCVPSPLNFYLSDSLSFTGHTALQDLQSPLLPQANMVWLTCPSVLMSHHAANYAYVRKGGVCVPATIRAFERVEAKKER